MRPRARFAAAQPGAEQPAQEFLEANFLVRVIPDREFFARRIDRAARIEPRREDAEVDVGEEDTEHNDAIARLDVAPDFLAAHGSLVHSDVRRMAFADDRFAKQRRGDRDAGFLGEFEHLLLPAEPVHLDVGQDDRLSRRIDHFRRFA